MAELVRELVTGTMSNLFTGGLAQRDSDGDTVGQVVRHYAETLLNIQEKLLSGFNQRYLNVVDYTEEKLAMKNFFQSIGGDAELADKVLNKDPEGKAILQALSDKDGNQRLLKNVGKLFYEESFAHPADFIVAKMEVYDKIKLNDEIQPDLKTKLMAQLEPTTYENNFFQFFVENKKNLDLALTAHTKFNEIEGLSYFLNVAYDLRGETDVAKTMFAELKSWHVVKAGNKTAYLSYIDPEDQNKRFDINLGQIKESTETLKNFYNDIDGKNLTELAALAKRPETLTKLAASQKNEAVVALAQVFSFYPGGVGTSTIEGSPADVQLNILYGRTMKVLEQEIPRTVKGFEEGEKTTLPKSVIQKTDDAPAGVTEWFTYKEAIHGEERNKKLYDKTYEYQDSYKGNPKNKGKEQELSKRDVLQYILYQELPEHANRLAPGRDHDQVFMMVMDLVEGGFACGKQQVESFAKLPDGGLRGIGCENGKGKNRIDGRNGVRMEYALGLFAKDMGLMKDDIADRYRNIFHLKGKGASRDLPDSYLPPLPEVEPKPDPVDTSVDRHKVLNYLYAKANLEPDAQQALLRGADAAAKQLELSANAGSKAFIAGENSLVGRGLKLLGLGRSQNHSYKTVNQNGKTSVGSNIAKWTWGLPKALLTSKALFGNSTVGKFVGSALNLAYRLSIIGTAGFFAITGYKNRFNSEYNNLGDNGIEQFKQYLLKPEASSYTVDKDTSFKIKPSSEPIFLNDRYVRVTDEINIKVPKGSEILEKEVTTTKFSGVETTYTFKGVITPDTKVIEIIGLKTLDKAEKLQKDPNVKVDENGAYWQDKANSRPTNDKDSIRVKN